MDQPTFLSADGQPRAIQVTYRQYVLLRAMLFDGASNWETGRRLELSEDTIKSHLRKLFVKIGVRDRLALCIAVWSGAVDVQMVCADGSIKHLLDELRQLQRKFAAPTKETEWPTTTPGTASPPPSRSSTSTPAAI